MSYDLQKTALHYASRAAAIGASMNEVCKRAGFSYATYIGWKKGRITDAYISSIDNLHLTLEKMENEYLKINP